jgi:hypothetical protein
LIGTLNVNWDEFALFARAHDTLRTGQLQGGGRPGLATIALIPFAEGCENALDSIRAARWLWALFTLAIVGGLWAFVRQLVPGQSERSCAALAVAAYVCMPDFLRHSVEVRADQPALAFAMWGGVALLSSRKRPLLALLAGAAVGAGFLFSQKAVYVAALVGFCAVVAGVQNPRWRKDALRVGLTVVGGVGVLVIFQEVLPHFLEPPPPFSVSNQLDTFDHYRSQIGSFFYLRAMPFYGAHLIVLATVMLATILGPRGRQQNFRLLMIWGSIALALAVMLFHTGSFPYFSLTFGIFPAVAVGLGVSSVRERYGRRDNDPLPIAPLWILLALGASWGSLSVLQDTQMPQREAFAFVARNLPDSARGFHTDRAFVCRNDPDPFPVMWGTRMVSLQGREGSADRQAFLDEFRRRPVQFIVSSRRLDEFPTSIRTFWNTHYVHYHAQVMVPGASIEGVTEREFRPLVPGNYRWSPEPSAPQESIQIGSREVGPGEEVWLDEGTHLLQAHSSTVKGWFALALEDPPTPSSRTFYLAF